MVRLKKSGERGGAKFNFLLTVLVLGTIGYAGFKVVPAYVDDYQFQDFIQQESRFALAGYPKKSPDDIRNDVIKKARELDLPLKSEDIRISVSPTSVDVSADYSVTFDLSVYQWSHDFHHHADNHTL